MLSSRSAAAQDISGQTSRHDRRVRSHHSVPAAALLTATFPLGDLLPDVDALPVRRGPPRLAALPSHAGPFVEALDLAAPSTALLQPQSQHVERGQVSAHPHFSIGGSTGNILTQKSQVKKKKTEHTKSVVDHSLIENCLLQVFMRLFVLAECHFQLQLLL